MRRLEVRGISSWASAGLSRAPPSVTMPVAPRASARAARMSPIVPAPGLAARVDHEHLAGPDGLDRALLRVQLGGVGVAHVLAQRAGSAACRRSPSRRRSGRVGRRPAHERVAHAALRDLHRQRGRRDRAQRRLGARRERHGPRRVDAERGRARGRRDARLGAERRRSGRRASTIGLRSDERPASSTSTTSPGSTGREPAGVPVRMMSPGSSVMKRERSATSSPNGKSRFAVESSCSTSPLTSARSEIAAGIDVGGRDARTERREAVVALREHVRAAIAPAHVVQADVVRGRVPADVRERLLGRDAARGLADDDARPRPRTSAARCPAAARSDRRRRRATTAA